MGLAEFIDVLLNYKFMQHALVTSVAVGVFCGVVGSFIVLRGMALMGDAISHAVLPGVAISYMLGANLFYGAVATGLLTALGIGYVSQNSRIKSDSAIGIVFSAAVSLGVLRTAHTQSATNLNSIWFGSVLTVREADMWRTLGVGVFVLLFVVLFDKELLVSSFDPTMAAAYGWPTRVIHYALMVLLSLVTVASLQTVGVVLVVAMLVTPASTAYLLTDRLSVMLWLAALFGVVSSVAGLYFSFVYNLTSGAVIVLVAAVLFALAFVFSPRHGVLWRRLGLNWKGGVES